jgi:hypothetical protein
MEEDEDLNPEDYNATLCDPLLDEMGALEHGSHGKYRIVGKVERLSADADNWDIWI